MNIVVDTSVILAIFFDEAHAEWAAAQLGAAAHLQMSTVNLAETLIRLRDARPSVADELEARLMSSGIRFVPPDADQARLAAAARLRYPLNLGDCFAYALAAAEGASILTLDRDFRALDVDVVLPPG